VNDKSAAGNRIFVLTPQGETLCITGVRTDDLAISSDGMAEGWHANGLVTFADQLLCAHLWLAAFEGL